MPMNTDSIVPEGPVCPRGDDIRARLQVLLADLDILDERLAAIHVQTALDCLGKVWATKESIDERSTDSAEY
mgnify:FL=1